MQKSGGICLKGSSNAFFAVLFSSLLLAGCLGGAGQSSTDSSAGGVSPASTSIPSVDPRALPLEQATEAMVKEMEKTGGDPDVATAPVAGDASFSGEATRSGKFQKLGYITEGSASLQQTEGNYFVVLGEDFSTPNGPDLVVYLTKNSGATTREDLKQGIALGELKSIVGKQVYEVPAGVDASQYNSISIHCRNFNVPWSYAPLN